MKLLFLYLQSLLKKSSLIGWKNDRQGKKQRKNNYNVLNRNLNFARIKPIGDNLTIVAYFL